MFVREDRGPIAVLRMAHGKASAFDLEFLRGMSAALETIDGSGARAMVLTGTGGIFSAGVDLLRLTREGAPYVAEFLPAMERALSRLFTLPLPTIAAVNGHAIAGGAILTWACDRSVMSRGRGRIGAPELLVGVPFPLLPLEILRSALDPREAREAALCGVTHPPDGALAHGFVDELADEGQALERACVIAEALAQVPRTSYRLTKAALRAPVLERLRREGPEHDAAILRAWSSEEVLGAVREYAEKTLRK